MRNSKELLKKANIVPRLKLATKKAGGGVQGTGPHRVKLVEDKIVKGKDFEGNVIDKMRFLVDENGETKMYECPIKDKETGQLHYLVQRMSEFAEGDEVIMEYKRAGMKGHIEVLSVSGGESYDEEESQASSPDEEVIDMDEE